MQHVYETVAYQGWVRGQHVRGQGQFSSRPRPVSSRPKLRPVIMIVEKIKK